MASSLSVNRRGGVKSVPKDVVVNTRAVLLSSKSGVLLKNFNKDYVKLVGCEISWWKCGFSSVVEMLQAMPEAVRFQPPTLLESEWRLYGVGTSDMFMPSWVIKAQGVPTPGSRTGGNHRASTPIPVPSSVLLRQRHHSNSEVERKPSGVGGSPPLTYNAKGLVSVYICWGKKQLPSATLRKCLRDMLRKVHYPQELVYREGAAFARYSDVSKAEEVIMKCNKKVVANGYILTVKPATDRKPQVQNGHRGSARNNFRNIVLPKMSGGFNEEGKRSLRLKALMAENVGDLKEPVVLGGVAGRGEETSWWSGANDQLELEEEGGSHAQGVDGRDNCTCQRSVVNFTSRPMSACVEPVALDTTSECHSKEPASPLCTGGREDGIQSIPNFQSCCQEVSGPGDGLPNLVHSWEDCGFSCKSPLPQATTSGESVVGDFEENDPMKGRSVEESLKYQSSSDDSLDDFDWDWSLLPQCPSPIPLDVHAHLPVPSSDSTNSSKLTSITSSLSLSLREVDHEMSVSRSSVPDEDFWGKGVDSTVSGYQALSQQHKDEIYSSVGEPRDDLIPVTISKMESPDRMWVQMVSDPDRVLDDMSSRMFDAKPPKLKEASLGKLCCFLHQTPVKKERRSMIRRALIKENEKKHVIEPQVGLILIDIGTELQCTVKKLHELPKVVSLETHPPLAAPLALRGVASSYYNGAHWYFQDLDTIKKILKDRIVYMEKCRVQGEVSPHGYTLATMFLDAHGKQNVADKLVDDCFFVTRSYPKEKPNSTHTNSTHTNSTIQSTTGCTDDMLVANKGVVSHSSAGGSLQSLETSPESFSSGSRRKRRSMMALITKAMAELEASKSS